MKYPLIFLIRVYQLCLAPFTKGACRFYPSCSEYGLQALKKHGAIKGCYLTVKRLCKCHPWHRGGVDEVP